VTALRTPTGPRALALLALVASLACADTSDSSPGSRAATPGTPLGGPNAFVDGPDLWLAPLDYSEAGIPHLGEGRNVTARAGYDNQPRFFPDGTILYTRGVGERTDIWRFDPATDTHTPVTQTPDRSEYSPTPTPEGGISAIVVEPDSLQRLWRFDLDGTNGRPLFEDVAPVGYHAWLDTSTVGVFVLGEPATLQLAPAGAAGPATEIDRDIGRSLNPVPEAKAISYPVSVGPSWEVRALVGTGGDPFVAPLVRIPAQDHAWSPGGRILFGRGHRLLAIGPLGVPTSEADATGLRRDAPYVVGELPDTSLSISRLAVSADGTSIVLVVDRPQN